MRAKLFQLCLTLCDSMNCSPPGSSVYRILQARILEWVAMPSSIFLSQESNQHFLCLLHWQVGSLPLVPPGKPTIIKHKVNLNKIQISALLNALITSLHERFTQGRTIQAELSSTFGLKIFYRSSLKYHPEGYWLHSLLDFISCSKTRRDCLKIFLPHQKA